jgi:tetratricopeptide (TPR) repeat protein
MRLLKKAGKETPTSAWPHFLLGAELTHLGRIQEAEIEYANAIAIAPRFLIARFELGTLQFTSGRPSIATTTWQPLIELENGHSLKLFVLGYLQLAQDAFESAVEYFKEGMKRNIENAPLNGAILLLIDAVQRNREAA